MTPEPMQSTERMIDLAHAHSAAEAALDLDGTLATLEPEPLYEFYPAGRSFSGMANTRRYYEYFFAEAMPRIAGYSLHGEWSGLDGLAQEYSLVVLGDDGRTREHRIVGIIKFGREKLTGERMYASDELFRFLVGPLWDEMAEAKKWTHPFLRLFA
jgi:hypothetical protein